MREMKLPAPCPHPEAGESAWKMCFPKCSPSWTACLNRWPTGRLEPQSTSSIPKWTAYFQASVARLWRLEHAVRNGQHQFRKAALEAEQWLAYWIETDPASPSPR